jgi:hypothetical protein
MAGAIKGENGQGNYVIFHSVYLSIKYHHSYGFSIGMYPDDVTTFDQ